MKDFTIQDALNIVLKHSLISILIFFGTFFILPNLNLIESRYSLSKIILLGEYPANHPASLLGVRGISEVLASKNMKLFLGESIKDSTPASYKIERDELGVISIEFKGKDTNGIDLTAKYLMTKLQEYDQKAIQKKIKKIEKIIDIDEKIYLLMLNSKNDYSLSEGDIQEFSNLKKNYDDYISKEIIEENSVNVIDLLKLKAEDTGRNLFLERQLLEQRKKITDLKAVVTEDFKTARYLYPVSKKEISRYYPNSALFFGVSLIIVFLYNLVLLNYKYRKQV